MSNSNRNGSTSGDGVRPTTDATVDNIGAGDKLGSANDTPEGRDNSPQPVERMADRSKDAAAVKQDGAAPFGIPDSVESPDERHNYADRGPNDTDR